MRSPGGSSQASDKRIGQHEAAFGIGVADLDRESLSAAVDVPGAKRRRRNGVLDDRQQHPKPQAEARIHHHVGEPQSCGGARHVLLHEAHAGLWFDVETAGIESHTLADQCDARRIGRPPSEIDEARRLVRGLPDGVDQRELPLQHLTANRPRTGAMAPRQIERRAFERVGPEVVGRRVHEIAGERQAAGDPLDAGAVDAIRRHEAGRRGRRRLVPAEPIG